MICKCKNKCSTCKDKVRDCTKCDKNLLKDCKKVRLCQQDLMRNKNDLQITI